MGVRCPSCRSQTGELMSCERCNMVGCARCVGKHNRQWLCVTCRKMGSSGATQSNNQNNSGQNAGFPGWFG